MLTKYNFFGSAKQQKKKKKSNHFPHHPARALSLTHTQMKHIKKTKDTSFPRSKGAWQARAPAGGARKAPAGRLRRGEKKKEEFHSHHQRWFGSISKTTRQTSTATEDGQTAHRHFLQSPRC